MTLHSRLFSSPRRRWLPVLPALLLGFVAGHAQDVAIAKPSPPPPPYVGTLHGNFTFTKKLVYKSQSHKTAAPTAPQPPTQPDLEELDSVQTGDLRRDQELFVDGAHTEEWRYRNIRFLLYPSDPNNVLVVFPSPNGYQDVPDFQEVAWVGADSFQGVQDFQGTSCYVYKSGDQTAFIDKSTSLPLYFESDLMQVTYSYKPPPEEPLQMPEKFQKRFQQVQRAWSGRTR